MRFFIENALSEGVIEESYLQGIQLNKPLPHQKSKKPKARLAAT